MGITAERMKKVNDFCILLSNNTNVLAREDIDKWLIELQIDEFADIVIETLKKRGVKIISRTNGEYLGFDRTESEDGTDRARETEDNSSYDEYLMDIFLNKIENEPLLSADEEYELANQIAKGRAADTILKDEEKSKLLSEQEKSTLQNKSELGKTARNRMIESNLHLVVRTAQRYRQPNRNLLDLIQEGNKGLIKAVDKFDCTKGYAFRDYASLWIRQAIFRATMGHGRIRRIDSTFRKIRIIKRLEELFRKAEYSVSLETSIGKEEDRNHGDFVSDIHAPNLEEEQNGIFMLETEEEEKSILMQEVCAEVWAGLSEREKRIMLHRYGIDDPGAQPFEKNEQETSVTRERVRQVESKIIYYIRRSLERRKQS